MKSLVTKMSIVLLGGVVPVPAVSERWINVMPNIVAKQASQNPIAFYKHFLEGTVLTHPELFAQLTAWGETAVGLGLTLGLLTGLSSLIGLVLVTNYGLATQWMSPGQQGFHIVLFALMIAFFARACGAHLGARRAHRGRQSRILPSRSGRSAEPGAQRPSSSQRRQALEAERPSQKLFHQPGGRRGAAGFQDQAPVAQRRLRRQHVAPVEPAEEILRDHQRPHVGVVDRPSTRSGG